MKIHGTRQEYDHDPFGNGKNIEKHFEFDIPDDCKIKFNEDRSLLTVKDADGKPIVALCSINSFHIGSVEIIWRPDPKTEIEYLKKKLSAYEFEDALNGGGDDESA